MRTRFWQRLLLIPLLGTVGSAILAVIPNPAPIRLSFDYPTNFMSTNLFFVLHGTQNVGSPPGNWPVDMMLPATNWYANGTGAVTAPVVGANYVLTFTNFVTLSTTPRFWYITASNLWGEADPSNVLALDAPAVKTGTLKAERAF